MLDKWMSGHARPQLRADFKFARAAIHRRFLFHREWKKDSESLAIRHTKRVAVVTTLGSALLKQTFLEVLNADARARGMAAIDERVLRDWINEDLFPGPRSKGLGRGRGTERRYDTAALKAALEVLSLKASNPHLRNAMLRIRLWLRDFEVPITRITEDIKSEFDRLVRRKFFRNPWQYDARSGGDPTELEIQKEIRRHGPPDQALVDAGLVLVPSEDILRLGSEWVWGSDGPSQLLKSLQEFASQFLSDKGQEALNSFVTFLDRYVEISGIFGDPEEIERSGLEDVAIIAASDLRKARRLYQFGVAMADFAARGSEFLPAEISSAQSLALSKIAKTLAESDDWCVFGLATSAILVRRVKSTGLRNCGQEL